MREDRRAPATWRGAALLPAATLAVHELRYLFAFGHGASRALTERGDVYVGWLAPLCVLILAVPLGALAGRVSAAWQGDATVGGAGRRRWWARWLLLALSLFACFCAQEVLEQLLEAGHPTGFNGVFGDGGWWALPAALAVAALLTLLIAGTRAAIRGIARVRCRPGAAQFGLAGVRVRRGDQPILIAAAPLADGAAGRAPPLAPVFAS